MKIFVSQLPCPEQEFLTKLDAYKAARAAHRLTVGVPAPFPEYEIFRVIVDQGGVLELQYDELQEQAQAVNRNALAELDELKARLAAREVEIETLKSDMEVVRAR